jgi:hypothetical protein
MDTELLKQLAEQSLWALGFALAFVLIFVGGQYKRYRKRKIAKREITDETRQLWEEVQRKRKDQTK